MPTNNCLLNIIGYCATPIEKMMAVIDLGAELRKIGCGLGMIVIIFNHAFMGGMVGDAE
jgi:hypothetical protein